VTAADSVIGNTDASTSAILDGNASLVSVTTQEPSTSTSASTSSPTPSISAQTLQGDIPTPTHQPSNPPPLHISTFPAFQMNGINAMPS